MSKKILIADDSLTIQKVINITLSNEPYDLLQAHSEDELDSQLESHPHLILLDFNLSEEKSGYELIQKINNISPKTKTLVMIGTFDNVDESLLDELGVVDRIIKPFESTKFIQKCRNILESIEEESETINEAIADDQMSETSFDETNNDDESDWVIESPEIQDSAFEEEPMIETDDSNPLENELSGWGMSVPSVIDSNNNSDVTETDSLFPPKINDMEDVTFGTDLSTDGIDDHAEQKIPTDDDLDYPSISLVREDNEYSDMDLLDNNGEIVEEPEDNYVVNEELIVEANKEKDPDDFWSVDEEEIPNEEVHQEVKTDQPESNLFPESSEDNIDYKAYDQAVKSEMSNEYSGDENQSDVVNQVLENLRPMVESMVKQLCQKEIERIAWEVIPDLAENLIKKEIKEISESAQ